MPLSHPAEEKIKASLTATPDILYFISIFWLEKTGNLFYFKNLRHSPHRTDGVLQRKYLLKERSQFVWLSEEGRREGDTVNFSSKKSDIDTAITMDFGLDSA